MQAWQISNIRQIEKVDRTESLTDMDSVKLRITKTLLTSEDAVTYLGEDKKVKYPIIPCTAAIGVINELPAESRFVRQKLRQMPALRQLPSRILLRIFGCRQDERRFSERFRRRTRVGRLRSAAEYPRRRRYIYRTDQTRAVRDRRT